MAITKAQKIYEEVERRIASGTDKADAFKALAEEDGPPVRLASWVVLHLEAQTRGRRAKRQTVTDASS